MHATMSSAGILRAICGRVAVVHGDQHRVLKGSGVKRISGLALSIGLVLCFAQGADAAPAHRNPVHVVKLSRVTFTLIVTGEPAPNLSYWVAHGPIDGRFGVIQLHPVGTNSFSASVTLPALAKTVFTYLASTGRQVLHGQKQPAGTIVTIKSMEHVTAETAAFKIMHWSAPLG